MNVNKILIGNKCDCQDQRVRAMSVIDQVTLDMVDMIHSNNHCPTQAISYEEGESLAKEYNIHFYETSAKQDINVEKSFITIATDVKNR